jgi:predicted ATP-grasp superfamily ATP-dependent carboligase
MTRAFLKAVGYRGIVDIGYRYDARDGRYKLLDVNPRIGATFRLFVGADGLDVARAFYMDMTGQPVPATRPSAGRKWLLEEDFISFRQYIRDGHLSWSKWVGSLRGVKETAWFAVDDPTPFFFRVLNRLRRKAGASAAP